MKNSEKVEVQSPRCNYIQWIAVLSVFVLILQLGLNIGWASPNFAWLLSEESPISATASDVSWIASLTSIGSASGAVLGSICMDYIGSRRTLLLTYLFIGISWSCLLVANSIGWFYAARIIGAIPCVMMFGCFSMYLGEISTPEIRGTLISLAITGSPVGTVLSTVAETYLPIKVSSSIYLAAALIGIMLMLWLKDTPYYLLKKNDLDGAVQAIKFYHPGKKVDAELDKIKTFVEKSEQQNVKDKIREFRSPVIKRTMFAIFILCGLPHLSGYGNLLTYMEIILKSAKFDLIKPEEFVIYATLVKVVVAITVVKLMDKLGRKFMLTVSSVGTSVAMFALGLHFFLLKSGYDGETLQWLPIASIVLYLMTYPVGFSTVPGAYLSEMFPERVKSIAVFLASVSGPLFGFIVTKAYQPIIDVAGEEYAFWCHSILSLLGIPCAVFLMIETKGKSFHQIQEELVKKWHL